jgi:hypothetical protein
MTYLNLRDEKNGMDQVGKEIAIGAYNLAYVILEQKGDLKKVEELAREALRIRTVIYGNIHVEIGVSYELLAKILHAQGELGDVTRELYEHSLSLFILNMGSDSLMMMFT